MRFISAVTLTAVLATVSAGDSGHTGLGGGFGGAEGAQPGGIPGGLGGVSSGGQPGGLGGGFRVGRPSFHGAHRADKDKERLVPGATQEIPLPDYPINATESFLPAAEGEVFYLDSGGSGDAILLIHAGTGSAQSWAYQFPEFSQAGYRVLAPSSRGVFGTTAPQTNVSQILDDFIAILDTSGIEKAHVLGTAAGGGRALRLALKYPDRIKSLTLACTHLSLGEEGFLERQDAMFESDIRSLPTHLKELAPSYRRQNPAGMALWREVVAEAQSGPGGRSVDNEGRPGFAEINTVELPVHLIFGGADLYAPPATAREFHEQFSDSRLTLIAEAGHSAFWENPSGFNKVVLGFVEKYN